MPERLDANSHPADAKYANFQLLLEAGDANLQGQIVRQRDDNASPQHGFTIQYYKNQSPARPDEYMAVVTPKSGSKPARVVAPGDKGNLEYIIKSVNGLVTGF